MESHPGDQQQAHEGPLSFWEVVAEEYSESRPKTNSPERTDKEYARLKDEHLAAWREFQELKASGAARSEPEKYQTIKEKCQEKTEAFRRRLCNEYLHKTRRSALCLSGGGIRSATFGLGVLQGLAKHSWKDETPLANRPASLLSEFDYISTVSGGGYVGSWFSAWAERERKTVTAQPQKAQQQSTSQSDPDQDAVNAVIAGLVAAPDTDPVLHLRRYSNYLTPQMGFLSADTWTWVATFLRNMLLNWLVVLPLLAAILLIPKLCMELVELQNVPEPLGLGLSLVGLLTGAFAYAYLIQQLPSAGNRNSLQNKFLLWCLGALSLSAFCLSTSGYWLLKGKWTPYIHRWDGISTEWSGYIDFAVLVVVIAIVASLAVPLLRDRSMSDKSLTQRVGMLTERIKSKPRATQIWLVKWVLKAVGAMILTTLLAGFLIQQLLEILSRANPETYTVFAFPMVMGIVIVTQALLVGLVSLITTDDDREWWGRAGGWLYLVALGWMAGSSLVLFAGNSLGLVGHGGKWVAASVLSSLSLGGVASALGFSDKSKAINVNIPFEKLSKSEKARKIGLQVLLLIFLVLLVLSLASLTTVLGNWAMHRWNLPDSNATNLKVDGLLTLIFVGISFFMAPFINTNKFSLHGMYRDRLIRAFLGASNQRRSPNWFTGFDPKDNLSMHELLHKPLHVVNMSLNLVKGGELAWQERKAESLTSSAMHTGSMRGGYQRSNRFGRSIKLENEPDRVSLGGAVAVSGAAATPNMGYHSSPLLTAVMALFNARLGAWWPNPGQAGQKVWEKSNPTWALSPFYDEALGLTDDTHEWVYLSDGGHFENLGLYEMVARRCHFILAIDASCDPDYHHGDLANAIRKIRTDLGIPIVFSDGLPTKENAKGKHYAIGHIYYSHVDAEAEPGILIYVQPSLTCNEPRDVADYYAQHPNFPQQPTTDQWFDESQFESYRCLGEHVIHEIVREEDSHSPTVYSLEEFFTIAEKGMAGALVGKLKAAVGL